MNILLKVIFTVALAVLAFLVIDAADPCDKYSRFKVGLKSILWWIWWSVKLSRHSVLLTWVTRTSPRKIKLRWRNILPLTVIKFKNIGSLSAWVWLRTSSSRCLTWIRTWPKCEIQSAVWCSQRASEACQLKAKRRRRSPRSNTHRHPKRETGAIYTRPSEVTQLNEFSQTEHLMALI